MMKLPKEILIVEDETITQRYLKNILEQYDMNNIDCVDNAKDALVQLKAKTYEMILMDINIKGSVDGIQLAREILNKYTLPIVFITAHNDTETFQEVLDLSPYGFISKPFSAKDVEVAVQLAYKRFLVYQTDNNKEVQIKESFSDVVISESYLYSFKEHKLYHKEQFIKLNLKQNKLLEILSKNLNSIVTYDIIISEIWADEMISDSALRTLVYTIRKNLPDLPIISHSKLGYSLSTDGSY